MTKQAMSRRSFTKAVLIAPGLAALGCGDSASNETAAIPSPQAWNGYDQGIIVDALASPGPFNVPDRMGAPLSEEMLRNARASGITAVNVTVSGGGGDSEAVYAETLENLDYWADEVARNPDSLTLASTVAEIHQAKEDWRLALIMGFQDTTMIGTDIPRFDELRDRGVVIMQLTYNVPNFVGEGCLSPTNGGLTDFGQELVARMVETGVLIDVSHCGQRTTAEAIAAANGPISITHSGCSAIYEHPRSKRDEELRAMADKGGVLGLYMMPFLNAEGPANADHLYTHIEHALDVCGEDHVGIGSDNSITPTVANEAYLSGLKAFADERQRLGIGAPREHELLFVTDLNEALRMKMIGKGLSQRGHSAARIDKILGGNWMRLFGEVWS